MKVLYVVGNYPKFSETYIAAEIAFMRRQGVEIEVWSKREGTPGMEAPVPVHRGGFLAALRSFNPHLVHVHYLIVGHSEILAAGSEGVPVTIRGHSFDFTDESMQRALGCSYVRRIYLFPHFAARYPGSRVMPVPVAYDSLRYQRHAPKNRSLVLRTCAAKPTKGIADFLRISALCPKHRFVLLANMAEPAWMPTLRKMVRTIGRVEFHEDVPNEEAARWTREAGIYLDTSDPLGHDFGMPISVAESMATGSLVLIRHSREASDYVGPAGVLYPTNEAGAAVIQETAFMGDDYWKHTEEASLARAQLYADTRALAPVLEDWRAICRSRSR